MPDTCASCRFGFTADETRFCRFDPPEFVPPCGSQIKPVRADGWCGKYEKEQKRRTTTRAASSAS